MISVLVKVTDILVKKVFGCCWGVGWVCHAGVGFVGFGWYVGLWLGPWVGFWLGPLDGCVRGWFVVRVWVWVCLVGFRVWCGWFVWVVWFLRLLLFKEAQKCSFTPIKLFM